MHPLQGDTHVLYTPMDVIQQAETLFGSGADPFHFN